MFRRRGEKRRAPSEDRSQLSWLVGERSELLVSAVIKLEELEAAWPTLQARVCALRNVSYAAVYDFT